MGNNIDLMSLMGLPEYVRCPKCKEMTHSNFDDYDIDCGNPNADNEIMKLDVQCDHCEEEFEFDINVTIITKSMIK